jgi:DNA mismatch repair protein MutH
VTDQPSSRGCARAPADLAELEQRAAALAGRSILELAREAGLGRSLDGPAVRTKGKVGALLEKVLGASAGSTARPDFPALGVELKTIPVRPDLRPRESTFVCAITLAEAERAEWRTSWARQKLSHVLWVPIVHGGPDPAEARVGTPVFWRPTPAQDDVLARDFDDAMGQIAIGGIEGLDARAGRWLQVRPKAATGRDRALAFGEEGQWIATVPRGFYLRARFTEAILRDPCALPP